MVEEEGMIAHYTGLKNIANILYDKKIKFSRVKNTNDPRESASNWIILEGIGLKEDAIQKKLAEDLRERISEGLRVFCGSSRVNHVSVKENNKPIYQNPRMWAQYGDKHEGFCIILNRNKINEKISHFPEVEKIHSDYVNYVPWLHEVESSISIQHGDNDDLESKNPIDLIRDNKISESILFKKDIDWEQEREYRWLVYCENEDDFYLPIEDSIKAVVLGEKFPENQYSQAEIYCRDLGCPCYIQKYQHPIYKLIGPL